VKHVIVCHYFQTKDFFQFASNEKHYIVIAVIDSLWLKRMKQFWTLSTITVVYPKAKGAHFDDCRNVRH